MKTLLPLMGILLCSCATNEFSVGMPLGLIDQKVSFLTVSDLPDVEPDGFENLSSAQQGVNFRWEGSHWSGHDALIVELSPFASQSIPEGSLATSVEGGQQTYAHKTDLEGARYSIGMRRYWYPGKGLYVESMLGLLTGYQVNPEAEDSWNLDPAIVLSLGLGYKFPIAPRSPFFFDCRAAYDIHLTPLVYDPPIDDILFDSDEQVEITSSGTTVSVGFGFSF